MKDNLFELLLSLFEQTLTQLKKTKQVISSTEDPSVESSNTDVKKVSVEVQILKEASYIATRIFTEDERIKLTNSSYQFLMRLSSLKVLSSQSLELIINRLFFSDSRFVSLQETKWIIRNTLAQSLSADQQAFLELVLYCQEDGISLH